MKEFEKLKNEEKIKIRLHRKIKTIPYISFFPIFQKLIYTCYSSNPNMIKITFRILDGQLTQKKIWLL